MNENSWFYFYSANAQVFGGLIAISAVFMVYALQWIGSSIEWSRTDLVNLYRVASIHLADQTLDVQLRVAKEELPNLRKRQGSDSTLEIERVIGVIDGQRERRKTQTRQFIRLLISKIAILSASLFLLPWGPLAVTYPRRALGITAVVLAVSIIVLICMGVFIHKVLDRDSKHAG